MKNYPVAFTAKKNAPSGSNPIWLLLLDDGVTTYYISDRVMTVKNLAGADVTTVAWVSNWGELIEGIANLIGEFSIGELRIHLLNDPNNAANIMHIIDNHDIETKPAFLCCWFSGIADPCQIVFCGYVREINIDRNDSGAELLLQDPSLKSDKMVGTIATKTLLGNGLDPSDVGKILPIVFGTVKKVPGIRAIVPVKTTLKTTISATDTTLQVSDVVGLTAGMTLIIDDEKITIGTISGQNLTGCTRGVSSTTPVQHDRGTIVLEYKDGSWIKIIAADHAVSSITKVWSKIGEEFLEITALCTLNAGAIPANVMIPNSITVKQMTSLNLTGLITALNALHSHNINSTQYSPTSGSSTAPNTSFTTVTFTDNVSYQDYYRDCMSTTFVAINGTISASTLTMTVSAPLGWAVFIAEQLVYGPVWNSTGRTFSITLNPATQAVQMNTNLIVIKIQYRANTSGYPITYNGGFNCTLTNISRAVTYTPNATQNYASNSTAGVTIESTLALSGNQIAWTLVESGIYCDIVNSNVDTPKSACDWLLTNYGPPGIIACSSDNAIHTTVGNLNSAIINQKPVSYWLNRIAFEFRSRFKWNITGAALMYRVDALVSNKTVTRAQTNNFTRRLSDYEDIINVINLKYARDWSNSDAEPYTQVVSLSDATSQSRFGFREKSDLFRFDFITDATLAANIAAWYLAHYKSRHWIVTLELFLDNMELEFKDNITVEVFSNRVGEIMEARLRPGDDQTPDGITIIVEV